MAMITVECSGRFPVGFSQEDAVRLVRLALRIADGAQPHEAPPQAGRSGATVNLSLVSDRDIRSLNRRYRGLNQPTDVLSFGYSRSHPAVAAVGRGRKLERQLGDIVVSTETARRSAKINQRTLKAELALLMVHGCLHLLGFDHDTQAKENRMFCLQQDILSKAGIL